MLNQRSGRLFLRACSPIALLAVGLNASGIAAAADGAPAAAPRRFEVESKRDVPYYEGPDADKIKHKLDLFLPKDKADFPVLFFVHGGAWVLGDKSDFGMYAALGRMLASHGIGAVVTNYRLSPKVVHPEHIKDVARAFAWAHKNIAAYGGRPDQMFVCGHSAGGHLVSLLATDETYLKAEGLSLADIKGAAPISGVYAVPGGWFKEVFGKDEATRKAASPLNQVHPGCPPFLIVYGDKDFPFCDIGSLAFCKALKDKQVAAETLEIKQRGHIDIIIKVSKDDDPCGQALLDFVTKHCGDK